MVESDISEIPSELIRSALKETVENKLKSKDYKIKVSSASTAGENNFVGILYRVSFNTADQGENGKSPALKLILKVAPQNEARRAQFFSHACFLREIFMYDEVLPYFKQFEQSKGVIIDENGFREYPKCYRFVKQEPSECVLLEDLSVRGYTIIDRHTQSITADHVRLVMQLLGKFHAISFALKDQQPDKFNKYASCLDEIFINRTDPNLRGFFNQQAQCVFKAVSNEEDAHLLAKVKKLYENEAIDIAADCLKLESTDGAAVISHGDAWQNNTMFRYDDDGKPIEINLIDWQISRHCSPIIDIVYYMFCCTTKELRDAHYDDFLKVYHESLSAHIRRLGSDPEQLFPYQLMLDHFRKFAKFGLILATVLLPMLTSDSGSGIDLDEVAGDVQNGKTMDANMFISDSSQKRFDRRLRDVVVDMVRLEYI